MNLSDNTQDPSNYIIDAEPISSTQQEEIPFLDNLTPEQKDQLGEFQKRMELYNKSRSGHKAGDVHKYTDGSSYLVTKSGAYQRLGSPRKSRKAAHRLEVANRKNKNNS